MTKHIMVDLETWSTDNNAGIISIGAVAFDPVKDTPFEKFHVGIDPLTWDKGSHISPQTILWWMRSENDHALTHWQRLEKTDLVSALAGFREWFERHGENVPVWANSPSFDLVILSNAFRRHGIDPPWNFYSERCYRTLRALYPHAADAVKKDPAAVHTALGDAIYQAGVVRHIVRTYMTKF